MKYYQFWKKNNTWTKIGKSRKFPKYQSITNKNMVLAHQFVMPLTFCKVPYIRTFMHSWRSPVQEKICTQNSHETLESSNFPILASKSSDALPKIQTIFLEFVSKKTLFCTLLIDVTYNLSFHYLFIRTACEFQNTFYIWWK